MAWLKPDLAEAFMHAGLAPRWAPMGAGKEVPHGLGEVAQRLLLHSLGPGRQPVIFSAYLRQLGRLLVIPWGTSSWLPKLLLLHGQVPHKAGMLAMLQEHQLLYRRWQQPKPRHTRNVTTATDTNGHRTPAPVVGAPPAYQRRVVQPKENR